MPFPLQPRVFDHSVHEYGFATDDALAALLDRYPEELFDINAYSFDDDGQVSLETGSRGRADGATILSEIKAGRLWVNLRDVQDAEPDIWNPIHEAFQANMADLGIKPIKATGQLILSSPGTKVPFHFDAAGVMLFHLRGRKRLFVYPNDEAHLPQQSMEAVVMRTTTEELPYSRAYDANAEVFDMEPGQALTWPLYAPHRVENLDAFNVSMSLDFQTWGSRITRGAHFANGVMRRQWGMRPAAMGKTPMAARAALWACSLAMKKANLAENRIKDLERSFELGAGKRAAA